MYKDEIEVEFVSALGSSFGKCCMPKSMESGLKETYLKSGTVKSTYLYIDGKEITDGVNYNPYKVK